MILRTLYARLVLNLMLILVLVLGGGGLFWFWSETRHLNNELDLRLDLVAEQVLASSTDNEPQSVAHSCFVLSSVARQLFPGESLALLSSSGDLICRFDSPAPLGKPPTVDRRELPADERGHYFDVRAGRNVWRSLVRPFFRHGTIGAYLQVDKSFRRQSQAEVWMAFASICGIVALLAWLLVKRELYPLRRTMDWIEGLPSVDGKAQPPQFPTPSQEIERLQQAVGDLWRDRFAERHRSRQFLIDASHELRTPLTILRGETEVALRWVQDPEETRKILVSNLEEIDRMNRIIEDLMLLSKGEIGEMALRLDRLDLCPLLTDIYQQIQLLGEKEGLQVDFEGCAANLFLQGDSLRLRQLFLNLLSNAIKYTRAPGRVVLKIVRRDSLVEVGISDTGIGIAPEHLPQIFDRFYRVDKVLNQGDGGSGLGLAIAQWIAQQHQGRIEVHSVLGQGSEFTVILPLVE